MRIHSDSIEELDVRKAANLAGVSFTRFRLHGSRKRAGAFDVILTGSSPRRQNGGGDHAATWDEWGHFLNTLFTLDPDMVTPYYENAEHFHWVTANRFRGGFDLAEQHTAGHKWDWQGSSVAGTYSVASCKCGAINRWMIHGNKFSETVGNGA